MTTPSIIFGNVANPGGSAHTIDTFTAPDLNGYTNPFIIGGGWGVYGVLTTTFHAIAQDADLAAITNLLVRKWANPDLGAYDFVASRSSARVWGGWVVAIAGAKDGEEIKSSGATLQAFASSHTITVNGCLPGDLVILIFVQRDHSVEGSAPSVASTSGDPMTLLATGRGSDSTPNAGARMSIYYATPSAGNKTYTIVWATANGQCATAFYLFQPGGGKRFRVANPNLGIA